MTLTKTPICNFGEKAKNFNLLSTDNTKISLNEIAGKNGTLIMFICNHCPYVKAIIKDIVEDVIEVISKGAAQSWQMENRYKTMIDDKFDFGFAVDWMRKDLKIAIDEAKKNNSPLPIAEIVDGYYEEIQKMGGNRWDTSSLIRRFRKK